MIFLLGGLDVNQVIIPDLVEGIPHPILPADPENQFRYSNGGKRRSLIVDYNQLHPGKNLKIPADLDLPYV